MLSKVWSAATLGIDAVRIVIEVDVRVAQQPGFTLVGLPDPAVRESYSRVRSALANCGLYVPCRHITVNLSPGDVRKEGSGFDLPIALGILHALEALTDGDVAGRVFVGELSLDGAPSGWYDFTLILIRPCKITNRRASPLIVSMARASPSHIRG